MSALINEHYSLEFTSRVTTALQEMGKVRPYVTIGQHTGESAAPINRVGPLAVSSYDNTANRLDAITETNMPIERVWVDPTDSDVASFINKSELVRLIEDPRSAYVFNHAAAMARATDDAIIAAADGVAKVGKTGTATEAFDAANFAIPASFGAAADTGATVAKLLEIRKRLQEANVDLDMEGLITAVISPAQEAQLMKEIEISNDDYNDGKPLANGMLKPFLGFRFVVSNRLAAGTPPNSTKCLAFVKSGIHLGVWSPPSTMISKDITKRMHPWQIYTKQIIGATRTEQGKVLTFDCLN